MSNQTEIKTLGLFEKRIQGDDCLMELARRRFCEAGMGAEMHAANPEQLGWSLQFRPAETLPVVVHLPREFNLTDEQSRNRILELARRAAGRVYGLVLHDHPALAARKEEYLAAAWTMDDHLEKIDSCPLLFIEYAAGLEPSDFAQFFSAIRDLDRISACIDIGHVGIRAARAAFARKHGGEDVCSLKSQGPRLRQLIADVEDAVANGANAVFELLQAVSKPRKVVHFHLHDGHPLSTFSPFGVSDHLSFTAEIPLNFEHRGRRSVPLMFGPEGLAKVVSRAVCEIGPQLLSFTLEIHPTGDRLPLGDAEHLFGHWTDKTNAEQMNHWVTLLVKNHELLRQAIDAVERPVS